MNRRQFVNRTTVASLVATTPLILPSTLFGATAPSKKVTVGCIGLGPQGMNSNMAGILKHPNAQVVAVCDCDTTKLPDAKAMVDQTYGNQDCKTYQDFREILNRKDIDAVSISTPDHWHVPMTLMAFQAGKDVLCEKPTITLYEGRELVEEAKRLGRVFQWGIEDRSYIKYWMLAGIARTGAIGDVHSIECCLPNQELFKNESPCPVPEHLDWNLWLGPARDAEYTPNVTDRWRWRQRSDYSGGSLTDWGAHLCDTAQVAIEMENSGPSEILGTCRELPTDSYVDVPSGYDILYRYSNNKTVRVRDTGRKTSIRIEGTKGWVACTKWNGEFSASDMNLFRNKELGEHPNFWPRPDREQKEFIDAVINRGQTTYHPEAGHRLSSMLHLGHIAAKANKTVYWDPMKEEFLKDASEHKANRVYRRDLRNWEADS